MIIKAEKRNLNISEDVIKIEFLQSDEAQNLLKLIVKFPEEIYDAATSYEPHRICTFLLKFAASFHKFYTEHRILSDDIVKTSTYLYLATAVKIVMRNGLTLLGVSAPEKM